MKKQSIRLILVGVLEAAIILIGAYYQRAETSPNPISSEANGNNLKREALEILETKCNVCHKKQNPLIIFKEKNMSKRAKKIYQMVFVERKMPKGNEIRLTDEEIDKLENWLFTQNIL
jgi:uncharacterized membrane protein